MTVIRVKGKNDTEMSQINVLKQPDVSNVEWCAYIIQNVPNNVPTQRQSLKKTNKQTKSVSFGRLPLLRGRTSQQIRQPFM